MQVWRPDTCGCVIEQSVDHSGPEAVVSMTRFLSKCPAHADLDDGTAYEAIYDGPKGPGENKRKNLLETALLADDSLGLADVAADGARTWKPGHSFAWSFSGKGEERVLAVEVKGAAMAVETKAAVQTLSDEIAGEGKVVIG